MSAKEENLDDVIASLIDDSDDIGTIAPSKDEAVQDFDGPVEIQLSPRAAKEVLRIRSSEKLDESLYLRVAVEGGGCSGLSYRLGFDHRTEQDLTCTSQDLVIVVDPRHAMYLNRCMIDYPDGLDARGFTFSNPNASDSCGCGSSFAV